MKKIAFIGAGSFEFTRCLAKDILSFPGLADCTLALMDIDDERLAIAKKSVDKIIEQGKYPAKVIATKDRVEALRDADGVVCTILCGGIDVWRHDIEIPKKYGVDINIGDTRGPAGIFRALRTIPVMLDICRDVEKYCPEALILNYTNPMSMICRAVQGESKVQFIGLCHSVQATSLILAKWIGAPIDEITYRCAGINHQAFFLDFKWNGKDAYPMIHQAITTDKKIYQAELVRNEMYLHLGYYVTESSGHNSEYNAWFRKRPDLIEKYCTYGTHWNPGVYAYLIDFYQKRESTWKDEINDWLAIENMDLKIGFPYEYASYVFNAVFGDHTLFRFNGNVRNFGLIDNLPEGSCVEVPMLASKYGIESIHVGPIPDQLAPLLNTNARCDDLAAEAAITGDPGKVFYACCHDPLTSAVLSLAEIKQMVEEMLEVNKEWLPQFKHTT